jgi:hypothetical protein
MIKLIIAFALLILTLGVTYPYKCKEDDRSAASCPSNNEGVCGNYDSEVMQCALGAPCGQSYINSCIACNNPMVKFVTQGECQNLQ